MTANDNTLDALEAFTNNYQKEREGILHIEQTIPDNAIDFNALSRQIIADIDEQSTSNHKTANVSLYNSNDGFLSHIEVAVNDVKQAFTKTVFHQMALEEEIEEKLDMVLDSHNTHNFNV